MNLLKRYESDDFDESYAFDDAENGEFEESGSSKPFLVKAIAMILAVTGIAYGANIALTSGGTRTEFGQGFTTTTACDTNGGITVIPYAGFINDTGTGKFSLDSIILENVDANCVGEDFTIQVYAETGTALTVSESATSANGGSYVTFDLGRFYFQDSATVVAIDKSYIDYDILTDVSTSTEYTSNQNSIQITFDPDRTLSFADASQVRRITIQTVKH
ncbi:hypothetical protein MCEMRE182_01069 [Candidatus Nanopelagicaceae bacterium]